jgi:hypothetical protein
LRREGRPCESTEFSKFLPLLVWQRPLQAAVPLMPRNITEPCSNRWRVRLTCSGYAGLRYRTRIESSPVCRRTPHSSARGAARCLNQATAPLHHRCRMQRNPRRRWSGVPSINNASIAQHTSTHSAATSSAMRAGAILTALWIEPAAGTTSSNAFSETSQ